MRPGRTTLALHDETMKNTKLDPEEVRLDPLEVIGADLMIKVLELLDARSLILSLLVSHSWFSLASSDLLWSPLVRITRDDLCDHAWTFHYTENAPAYWRSIDPYWNGTGQVMRRYFQPDGSINADPEDKVWGGHESSYTVVTSVTVDGGVTRENYVRVNRWPRMRVTRRQDWGWDLSNVIARYSSIPDADKEGSTGPMY